MKKNILYTLALTGLGFGILSLVFCLLTISMTNDIRNQNEKLKKEVNSLQNEVDRYKMEKDEAWELFYSCNEILYEEGLVNE